MEFAEGIPGSVGGGLLMNAGAFGGELSRVVTAIRGVRERGALRGCQEKQSVLPIVGLRFHRSLS